MVTGGLRSTHASVVGDRLIAERDLEAALEHLPARGRLAVDRITISERDRLRVFLPDLELVDAGPIVLAGSTPRADAETLALRAGYLRTEHAVEAARRAVRSGETEHRGSAAVTRAGAQLGLDPHIEHIWTVLPRERASVPWLRGEWAGRAPWRQLSSERAIARGDLVALDAGFFFDGYVTDFGWTDVADRVTAAIRPGATAADLRAAACTGWTAPDPPWPFGLYVAHGVGFGGVVPPFAGTDLGVEAERFMVLEPGDVLMVEPYVFVDGIGGFRAERCVAVTETGAEVWTTLPVEQLTSVTRAR